MLRILTTPSQLLFQEIRQLNGNTFPSWFSASTILDRIRRIDTYLSYQVHISGGKLGDMVSAERFHLLHPYLRAMLRDGYLGRYGATVAPHLFTLNFPTSQISYLWIPKNSCTSMKLLLASFEPKQLQDRLKKHQLHETAQETFGMSRADYEQNRMLRTVAVLRDPRLRIVSCYLDKFALPARGGRAFEPFVLDHIRHFFNLAGIKRDPHQSITIREFLHYLVVTPLFQHDVHWLPQSAFLPGKLNDWALIPSHRLDRVVQLLGLSNNDVSIPIANARGKGRVTWDAAIAERAEWVTDCLPHQLPEEALQTYEAFLDPCAELIVQALFSKDDRLFQTALAAAQGGPIQT